MLNRWIRDWPTIKNTFILDILYAFHNSPAAGHLGVNRTKSKIQERFYWPRMSSDIKNYVLSCLECQTKKSPTQKPLGMFQPIQVGGPWETICVDLLGPFPTSLTGMKYIAVCTDMFTKYGEMKAIQDSTAATLAQFFIEEVFCRHGWPKGVT